MPWPKLFSEIYLSSPLHCTSLPDEPDKDDSLSWTKGLFLIIPIMLLTVDWLTVRQIHRTWSSSHVGPLLRGAFIHVHTCYISPELLVSDCDSFRHARKWKTRCQKCHLMKDKEKKEEESNLSLQLFSSFQMFFRWIIWCPCDDCWEEFCVIDAFRCRDKLSFCHSLTTRPYHAGTIENQAMRTRSLSDCEVIFFYTEKPAHWWKEQEITF